LQTSNVVKHEPSTTVLIPWLGI